MKKSFLSLLLILCICLSFNMLFSVSVSAYTYHYGDIDLVYEYENQYGGVKITGCMEVMGPASDLSIPYEINGRPVTIIGEGAFRELYSLQDLYISASVMIIEDYAFYGCSALSGVSFAESMSVEIGDYAFADCNCLANIYLPYYGGTVTFRSIGDYAFSNCSSLTDANITNDSGEDISFGNGVFAGCYSLERVSLPFGLTAIGDNFFCGCFNLIDVSVPETISYIGANAFEGCSLLSSVYIPDSVTDIGKSAFAYSGLTEIYLPYGITVINKNTFEYCSNLEYVYIPETVKTIDEYAFAECHNLSDITIPDSVTVIGDGAFGGCSQLESVEISGNVTSVGSGAFFGCSNMTGINVSGTNNNYVSVDGVLFDKDMTTLIQYPQSKTDKTYILPKTVTTIADDAFFDCDNLEKLLFSSRLTIGSYAFYDCNALINLEIASSNITDATIVGFGESSFAYCDKLSSIAFYAADDIHVRKNAFSNCKSLHLLAFWNCGEVFFEEDVFYKCPIDIFWVVDAPYTVENNVLFNSDKTKLVLCPSNYNISKYTIPDTVTSIEINAFSGCTNLTEITIPSSVKKIGKKAFSYCGNLKDVYYQSSQRNWNNVLIESDNYYLKKAKIHFIEPYTETTVSGDGKTFTVSPVNVETGKTVILALYSGNQLAELHKATYEGRAIPFTTTANYNSAKVFVWDDLDTLIPVCDTNIVK